MGLGESPPKGSIGTGGLTSKGSRNSSGNSMHHRKAFHEGEETPVSS